MLINFIFENFRSYKDVQEINLEKESLKDFEVNYLDTSQNKKAILCSNVIFGANASGKSNVVLAILALDELIMNSSKNKPNQPIIQYDPFLFATNENKDTSFEITFISNNIKFIYSISFDRKRINKEELFTFKNNKKSLLFERNSQCKLNFGVNYEGDKENIPKLLLENQLFYSKALENNVKSVIESYNFFEKLFIQTSNPDREILNRVYLFNAINESNQKFKEKIFKLILSLDTGISKLRIEKNGETKNLEGDYIPDEFRKDFSELLKFKIIPSHKKFISEKEFVEIDFKFEEESAGTKEIYLLASIIVDALENGGTYIIDEFQSNLHPNITRFLISLFQNKRTNPKKAQFIVVSHDISLLSRNVFRRDQIWFSEKDEYGCSELFRCSDIKGIRKDTPIDKWYLSGRFGAVPSIDDVEFLISINEKEE